jgi:hypothetical protein
MFTGIYLTPKSNKLTPRQKKSLAGYSFGKKTMFNGCVKEKYYCPEYQDTYLAIPKHTHCKLCFNRNKPHDHHEVVLYDKKIHHVKN